MPTFQVQSYYLMLGPQMPFRNERVAAKVICFSKGYICTFLFTEKEQLPPSEWDAERRVANVFVHAAQYPWFVDMLRNERPVLCMVEPYRPEQSYITTQLEPTGEGEQVIRT